MGENNLVNIPNKDKSITRDNHIPTPPTPGGDWKDEARDHIYFQENVSLAAQLGGVHASAGCLTEAAEKARQAAEQRYYRTNEKHPKQILEKKKIR